MNLKEKLEYLMNKNKINNAKELSIKSGIPYTTLRSILFDNVSNIRIDTATSLANCFNVSIDYLLNNTIIENPQKLLEEKLSILDLSKKDYEEIISFWTAKDSLPMIDTISNPLNKKDEANNIINEILTSYIKTNLNNEDILSSKDIENINEKQFQLEKAFISLLKSLDENKIVYDNVSLASYNGLNTKGLNEVDLREIQEYIDFKRKQRKKK